MRYCFYIVQQLIIKYLSVGRGMNKHNTAQTKLTFSPYKLLPLILVLIIQQTQSAFILSFQYTLTNVAAFSNTTVTFPASVQNTFQPKFVVLAGYSMQTQQVVDFQMYLQPSISNSSAIITVIPGGVAIFNYLSVYVVMVPVGATGYGFNISQSFVNISSYIINGSLVESYLINKLCNNVVALLSYFHAESQANAQISISVKVTSCYPSMNITTSRADPNNQIILEAGIIILTIDTASLTQAGGTPYYYKTFSISSNPSNNTSNLLTQLPVNFNISDTFANSTFGGFDGNCLIGLTSFTLTGNTSGSYQRTISFDATTKPISAIQTTLHQINSTASQNFGSTYQIVCFAGSPCPNNTLFDQATFLCLPCNITGCDLCYTYTLCKQCSSNYGLKRNGWLRYIPDMGVITNLNVFNGYTNPALCQPCPELISNCAQCLSFNICLGCLNDSNYLTNYNNSYTCLPCAFPYMPNCLTCTSGTYCTSCNGSQYYISLQNRLCLNCWDAIQYCITCSINVTLKQYNCTSCIPSMFSNSSLQCQSCSSKIPNCLNCDNNPNYCYDCITIAYGYNPSNNSCVLCYLLFPNCFTCTSTICLSCIPGLTLGSGKCFCMIGYLQGSICVTIAGCTNPFSYANGAAGCASCDPLLFYPRPINGICQCLVGTLVNDQCTSITGCVSPVTPTNSPQYCLFCNLTAGFQAAPVNGSCICPPKYSIQGKICGDLCGDGFLMMNASQSCDDGNLISGDGCSSKCKVEIGYLCSNGSKNSPSACVYVGFPLKISLNFIKRADSLNQGIFAFNIYPPLLSISKMNLSDYVTLDCQSTQYTIKSISYSLGVLQVFADYTQNMEGCSCSLNITFNNLVIISPNANLSFPAISRNIPLTFSKQLPMLATVKLIFNILSYIAIGLFVLSLFHKMIGAQLMFSCQIVYLSNCLYKQPSFLVSAVKQFNLVNGYWSLFHSSSDNDFLLPFTNLVSITPYFLQNSLIVVSILLLFFIVWIVMIAYFHIKNNNPSQIIKTTRPNSRTKSESALDLLYQIIIFPLTVSFFCVLSIAAFLNNQRILTNDSDHFSVMINAFFLYFTQLVMGTVFGIQVLSLTKSKYSHIGNRAIVLKNSQGLKINQQYYIPLFLLKMILFTIFIELGISLSFCWVIFIISVIILGFLIFLLFQRPYKSAINNFGAIILQITAFYSIFLAIVQYFYSIDESIELFLILILQGLLMISFLFTFIRIAYIYVHKIYKMWKTKQKQIKNQEILATFQKKYLQQRDIQQIPQIIQQKINPYSLLAQGPIQPGKYIIQEAKFPTKDKRGRICNQTNKKAQRKPQDQVLLAAKRKLKQNFKKKKNIISQKF